MCNYLPVKDWLRNDLLIHAGRFRLRPLEQNEIAKGVIKKWEGRRGQIQTPTYQNDAMFISRIKIYVPPVYY